MIPSSNTLSETFCVKIFANYETIFEKVSYTTMHMSLIRKMQKLTKNIYRDSIVLIEAFMLLIEIIYDLNLN